MTHSLVQTYSRIKYNHGTLEATEKMVCFFVWKQLGENAKKNNSERKEINVFTVEQHMLPIPDFFSKIYEKSVYVCVCLQRHCSQYCGYCIKSVNIQMPILDNVECGKFRDMFLSMTITLLLFLDLETKLNAIIGVEVIKGKL